MAMADAARLKTRRQRHWRQREGVMVLSLPVSWQSLNLLVSAGWIIAEAADSADRSRIAAELASALEQRR